MITSRTYEYALLIIEQYKRENNIDITEGDIYELKNFVSRGAKSPDLTVGHKYEILHVKPNYRYLRVAVAIRDNKKRLRWYSFDSVKMNFKKLDK